MRERTAEAVLRLLGKQLPDQEVAPTGPAGDLPALTFGVEERNMVSGVLTLAERSIHSIMTPRTEVSWVNLEDDPQDIQKQIASVPHSFFPVCRATLDDVVGIGRAKDMIADIMTHGKVQSAGLREPIVVHDTISIIRLMDTLKRSRGQLVLVSDEFGTIQGLVTPIDVFEAIAGEFPDEDETPDITADAPGRWTVDGAADLHHLEQVLDTDGLVDDEQDYTTLAGYLLERFGHLPSAGDACEYVSSRATFRFEVLKIEGRRIALVRVERIALEQESGAAQ
jgi:CBS domain containing-hemolysin-like protein